MLWIAKLAGAALLAGLLSIPAAGEERSIAKEDAVALVKSAIAFIKAHDAAQAYAEITDRSGKFVDRELYVVVQGLDGKVLAHGADRSLIGSSKIEVKDADGKEFVKERLNLAQTRSSFWQDYQAPNPVSKDVQPKQTYCERLNDTVVCAGIYTPLAAPGGC